MQVLKNNEIAIDREKLTKLLEKNKAFEAQNKEYKEAEDKLVTIVTKALFKLGLIDKDGNESPDFAGGITGKKIFGIIRKNVSISSLLMGDTSELEESFSFMAEIGPLYKELMERRKKNSA